MPEPNNIRKCGDFSECCADAELEYISCIYGGRYVRGETCKYNLPAIAQTSTKCKPGSDYSGEIANPEAIAEAKRISRHRSSQTLAKCTPETLRKVISSQEFFL